MIVIGGFNDTWKILGNYEVRFLSEEHLCDLFVIYFCVVFETTTVRIYTNISIVLTRIALTA